MAVNAVKWRMRFPILKDQVHSRFLRSAATLLAGTAASRLTTLVAAILISNILLPSEFGRLTILQSTIALLAGVGGLGLAIAVTRQVAEFREQDPRLAGRYLGVALVLTSAGGIIVTGGYLAARDFVATQILQNDQLANLIVASAGAVFFAGLTGAIQGALVGLEKFTSMVISQWIQAGATSAGMIVGAVTAGVQGALLGFSAGWVVAAGGSYYLLRREVTRAHIPIDYRVTRAEWRTLWRLGFPAFVAFLSVSAAYLGGQLLLAHRAGGYADVAAFNVAYRWHLALLFIPAAIAPVLLPIMTNLISQGHTDDSRRLYRLSLLLMATLTSIPAALLALAAPHVLALNGSFYSANAGPLIFLAIASIPSALNSVLSSASLSHGLIRAWLVSDLVLAGVLFITAIALIPSLGASGLAIAYLAGYAATDAILAVPLRNRLGSLGRDEALLATPPPDDFRT